MDLMTPEIHLKAPSEILLQVLSYLDVESICSCMRVSRLFYQTVEESLWKVVFFRDFSHFLYQKPLNREELNFPTEEAQIKMIKKEPGDPYIISCEPYDNLPCPYIQQQILHEASIQLQNWKGLFILCHMKIDLNGFWIGDYGRHGKEVLQIHHKGYDIVAKKVTGDENVPAGEVTWKMTLDSDLTRGKGFMQIAEIGYKNPTWVTAYIDVIDRNSLQITWFVYDHVGNWYSLTFGILRADASSFNSSILERRVEMMTFKDVQL